MSDFKLTIGSTEYEVNTSNSYTSGVKDAQDFTCNFKRGNARFSITIPKESNATRAKVLLFIEAFHVALGKAFDEQGIDQDFVWNKLNTK